MFFLRMQSISLPHFLEIRSAVQAWKGNRQSYIRINIITYFSRSNLYLPTYSFGRPKKCLNYILATTRMYLRVYSL